jgi:nitroreductase
LDTYLAIASKRDERRYADRALPEDVEGRILDAGRLSGSSQNRQQWEFVVVESAKNELARAVWAPDNVRSAALVVAIVGAAAMFDVGRCSQQMMLAAWSDGVVSCPNGIRDADLAASICRGEVKMILSFGYPERPRNVDARTAADWSSRANRKPLTELVRRI